MDILIAGSAIGIDFPISATDVDVSKLQAINFLLMEEGFVVQKRHQSVGWHWTTWRRECCNSWLAVGVMNRIGDRELVDSAVS